MLKLEFKKELEEQKISRSLILDRICEEREYILWMEEGEQTVWVMQVHAMAQRLGKSVDKYDVMLNPKQYFLAVKRSLIWQKIRKGELYSAGELIAEYKEKLKEMEVACTEEYRRDNKKKTAGSCGSMPQKECALHRQFLALSAAEIARRQACPYMEQLKIILGGLRQTIIATAWGIRNGKPWPEPGWCRIRRMHLMELFLLARFARLCECMGEREEAFLWYQGLAAYLREVPKDRADTGKLSLLICYRMAENRLSRMFGKNIWWEEGEKRGKGGIFGYDVFLPKTAYDLFAGQDGREEFKNAQECIEILKNLTDALELLGQTQRYFPLFLKMENLRLAFLREMPLFGDHIKEENTLHVLKDAWEDLCRAVLCKSEAGVVCGRVAGFDAFDSDYTERCMHDYLEIFHGRMELHGFDMYQLGEEIYSDPIKSLMPILKGEAIPKPQKRKELQKRLGMEWKTYDPGFITEDDAEYKKFARMRRMYYDRKLGEGRELLKELENKMDWKYMTNQQFGIYWDALFDWREGKITEEEKNIEMWKIVEYSGIKREKFMEVGCSMMRIEWWALMEIAWNCEGEDFNFWISVLKKQREYLEKIEAAGFFPEYYIKILYCLCYMEREMGNFDEAEQCAEAGLRAVYHLNLYTQWGSLLFEKFRIVEDRKTKEGMEEEDFKLIRQAYAVEKMFLKSDRGCKMVKDYLGKYYGQDGLADMEEGH